MSKLPVVARTQPTERHVGPTQPPLYPDPPKPPAPKPPPPPPAASVVLAAADPPAFVPKVYQPQDIACPHQNPDLTNCGAAVGDPCSWQQAGLEGTYHAERIADADAASQRNGIKPTQEQFDQAAMESGLF